MEWAGAEIDGLKAHAPAGTPRSKLLSRPRTRAQRAVEENDLQPYFVPQLFVYNRACSFSTFKGSGRQEKQGRLDDYYVDPSSTAQERT